MYDLNPCFCQASSKHALLRNHYAPVVQLARAGEGNVWSGSRRA